MPLCPEVSQGDLWPLYTLHRCPGTLIIVCSATWVVSHLLMPATCVVMLLLFLALPITSVVMLIWFHQSFCHFWCYSSVWSCSIRCLSCYSSHTISHFTASCFSIQSLIVACYWLESSVSWVVILTGLVTIPFTWVMPLLFWVLPVQSLEMLCFSCSWHCQSGVVALIAKY